MPILLLMNSRNPMIELEDGTIKAIVSSKQRVQVEAPPLMMQMGASKLELMDREPETLWRFMRVCHSGHSREYRAFRQQKSIAAVSAAGSFFSHAGKATVALS